MQGGLQDSRRLNVPKADLLSGNYFAGVRKDLGLLGRGFDRSPRFEQRYQSITQKALAGNVVDAAEEVVGFVYPDIAAQGYYAGP
jgi:hypothetical protein